jgi:Zn-finger nucleic acid-binding protein
MKCPKCISPMVTVTFAGIEVDRCTDCQGLFFDEFEKDQLKKIKGAGAIDIGDPGTGREFNKVDHIQCPRCGSLMIRMVDVEQPHIWFEHCTVCGGSFFDAGEFKDLAHHTIVDFFKDLLVEERK